jgi:NAD(P)H dehydrogenase (quinone)
MFWNSATRWVAIKLNTLTTQIPPPPKSEDDKAARKILLVQAHPLEDSFSAAIANAVVEGAKEGGHEIRRRSLYQEKYQCALSAPERRSYFETAKGALRLPKDTQSHLKDLHWCDSVVFVYPTWWFNMRTLPATELGRVAL